MKSKFIENIENLKLSNNELGNKGFEHIFFNRILKNLKKLSLNDIGIDSNGLKSLT